MRSAQAGRLDRLRGFEAVSISCTSGGPAMSRALEISRWRGAVSVRSRTRPEAPADSPRCVRAEHQARICTEVEQHSRGPRPGHRRDHRLDPGSSSPVRLASDQVAVEEEKKTKTTRSRTAGGGLA